MKRTNKKKLSVDAILTADWHLRESTPRCRTDDFEEAQWGKVEQVARLQKKHDCPVLHAGDLFHHWKPSPRLLSQASQRLPLNFHSIYGNHDLPQHSIDLAEKSGLYNLITNRKVSQLDSRKADVGFDNAEIRIGSGRILIAHVFTYVGKAPFPEAEREPEGHYLLDTYPNFDLILTGDNHQPFVCREEGHLLVNPGSLTRQNADQIDHKPRVYLYNSKRNKVKPYYLDCKKGTKVISRQHIKQKKERDERISAFVERLGTEWEGDLDFEENLKRFEKSNGVDKKVMEITYKALDQ